ncbi:hypothetical protein Tco_0766707 [Tanacetum coccineum]
MAEYSQKWHNGTSRGRSTKTSDGLAAIQAQLNNLGREIKKVNEKVYAAQVGCKQCKGPHYTKDFPQKEEGKTLEEAYYTQFDEYIVNAQNESNLSITSNDINIELNNEFLVELRKNEYHRWIDEDIVNHIAKVLEMIDLIYIPGVDSHQLRMKVFPLSLADDARQWWINKGEGKITVWEELIKKLFYRLYPDSYDGEEEMLDEGDN